MRLEAGSSEGVAGVEIERVRVTRVPGGCSARWILTGQVSPPPEPSPGVWSAAKVGESMYRPRALKDRLTTEMERWRLCHEEHRSLGGCNTKWVPAWSAAPPPEPSPGVWSAVKVGVSMHCSRALE